LAVNGTLLSGRFRFRNRSSFRFVGLAILSLAGITTLISTPSAAQTGSSFIYAGTGTGAIYAVDPVAKTTTLIRASGYSNINGLAWDPFSQRLYFTDTVSVNSPGDGGLHYWNRSTNTITTVLNAAALTGTADSASIYKNGYWYVEGIANGGSANDIMYRVDLSSLAITSYANFDGTGRSAYEFGDISIDSANGQLYGSATNSTNTATTGFDTFFKSSVPATSTAGTGYSQSTNAAANLDLMQIAVAPNNGVLYGVRANGDWFSIDKNTGAQTSLAFNTSGIGTITDLSDFASPTPAPPGVISGLIGIAMGGAQFGMVRFRKRRREKKDTQK
jgi:hypothetical protein